MRWRAMCGIGHHAPVLRGCEALRDFRQIVADEPGNIIRRPDMYHRANFRIAIEGGDAQNAFVMPGAGSYDMRTTLAAEMTYLAR